MPYTISAHQVKDFADWKRAFDGAPDLRKQGRMKSYRVLQAAEDPNYVVMLVEWDSQEDAQAFLQSDQLQAAMKHSGVTKMFDTYDTSKFLIEVEQAPV